MLKVGLTGGIASGKSTISRLFEKLGVPVHDTDVISHELMQAGEKAYIEAIKHFGDGILNDDQTINRSLLRQIVFDDPAEKGWLEQMIHPMIRQRSEQALREVVKADYAILVVPLLFESGFDKLVDHVIAIDCPQQVQIERLMERDGIDEGLAQQMISSQLSNDQRLARADSHITNADKEDRMPDVQRIHQQLLGLAQSRERQ